MANILDPNNSSAIAAVGLTNKSIRVSQHPVDVTGGGSYSAYFETGSMTAGLGANSEIVQFRNPNANPAIIERIDLTGFLATTGFAAGIGKFRWVVARSWSADGTLGATLTLSGDNNQLRQTYAAANCTIRVATNGALGAGTKTLDSVATAGQALKGLMLGISTATNTNLINVPVNFFGEQENGHPLILAQNEGIVCLATVPITGVWLASFNIRWSEATSY